MGVNNNPAAPSPLGGEGRGEGLAVNNQFITPPQPSPSVEGVLANSLRTQSEGNVLNPENPINQIIKLMSQTKKNFDISDIVSKLRNKKSRKDK